MFARNVCLVFLTWCWVLNRSAAEIEGSADDDTITFRSGTSITAPSSRPIDHPPGAERHSHIKATSSTGQGTDSDYRLLQEGLLEELIDYKFVFPHVLSGKRKWSVLLLPQRNYPNHISILLELEGEDLILDLSRKIVLEPREFQKSYYSSNGTLLTEKGAKLHHCYYQGSVRRFPGSQVSARTCSGLSALIVFSNRTYVIEHLEGDKEGRHFVYRPEDLPPPPSDCTVTNTPIESNLTDDIYPLRRAKRSVLSEMKYLELVVVTDKAMTQKLGGTAAVEAEVIKIIKLVDSYFRPLKIRIVLIAVEAWTADKMPITTNLGNTLEEFLKWRRNDLSHRIPNDNAQILLGNVRAGLPTMTSYGGVCTPKFSGGVVTDPRPSTNYRAMTMAHSIAHSLAIGHDARDLDCTCSAGNQRCIMNEALTSRVLNTFSSCSLDNFEKMLGLGQGPCLFNLPNFDKAVGDSVCGNKYVEENEQCDCGTVAECTDPCCVAATCQLKPGAKCSDLNPCCDKCDFLPAGTICRASFGECDLPEFCTGRTPHCPDNSFMKNGRMCNEGSVCFLSICPSLEKQCLDLWGEGEMASDERCYQTANALGSRNGHCGRGANGQFLKCSAKDATCGRLQCKVTRQTGLPGSRVESGSFRVGCRRQYSYFRDAYTDFLIQDGTKCSATHVCLDQKCEDPVIFQVDDCDAKCNEHGVCNNHDNCHCDEGWAPPLCKTPGAGGSIDSGPMNDTGPGNHSVLYCVVTDGHCSVCSVFLHPPHCVSFIRGH
ncbi:disintegrin and metalloproteinase domain-containing protein 12-like isoform X2 [Scyliorhinus canicula]|uniref:disintegrin and metalloproteinase domain-containing protein 12-like isoform X2 n=1 Tax=Scyliorhinus canicula TaxID=7830 RepID=UPI0018F7382F|nr:disintegrin and metalloproteinase domain-containing protein 12-like isoform X2 [Scyliorhinus canicula]